MGHLGVLTTLAYLRDQFWLLEREEEFVPLIVVAKPAALCFIRKNILFWWGRLRRIVTVISGAYLLVGQELSEVSVEHVTISAYILEAKGVVEWRYRGGREALVKTANAEGVACVDVLPEVFWVDRMTVQRFAAYSPLYLVDGVKPSLPSHTSEVTYLTLEVGGLTETAELLARRSRALKVRETKLEEAKRKIWRWRLEGGDLVLYRNARVETEAWRRSKPRYMGPMVVVRRLNGGAYMQAELDGTVSFTHFAAFQIFPYFLRANITVPEIIDNPLSTIPDAVEHSLMALEGGTDNVEEDLS